MLPPRPMKPMTQKQTVSMVKVMSELQAEREQQHRQWGEQSLPDGTGGPGTIPMARLAKENTENAVLSGELTWRHLLEEEVHEAVAETDRPKLRAELLQVAAIAIQWVEDLDRRK